MSFVDLMLQLSAYEFCCHSIKSPSVQLYRSDQYICEELKADGWHPKHSSKWYSL